MTYYIDNKENNSKDILKKISNYLFYKFSVIDVDNEKKCIYINKKYINNKAYKKINRYLNKQGLDILDKNTLIAKNIQLKVRNNHKNDVFINEIKYLQKEKYLMKVMLYEILKYIEKMVDADYRNESIYVTMISEKNKNVLLEIIDLFKNINIITTRIGYMRRLEKNILKNKDSIISISNNKRKALKRARLLINFDFNDNLLKEYNINRNCIIINLNNEKIRLNSNFQGCIIDSVQIDFKNQYEQYIKKCRYNIEDLYGSYIQQYVYKNAIKQSKEDDCQIVKLLGNSGVILNEEIINNFINSAIKLDKT